MVKVIYAKPRGAFDSACIEIGEIEIETYAEAEEVVNFLRQIIPGIKTIIVGEEE